MLLGLFLLPGLCLSQTSGPENGALVIAGGGRIGEDIINRFVELAGGEEAKIVFIPTAGGQDSYEPDDRRLNLFFEAGVTNVTLLHTRDKNEANTDEFIAPLKEATGVWFSGGRQWRLVDAYAGTKVEQLFWDVLAREGVIGGTSAGATIQGSYLARGDTQGNQKMMGDHEDGFGFVKNIAIDQHVLARNRHFDLFNILQERPELLGIGLDEGTAIVVQGNEFDVVGDSYVLIYDNTFWSREGSIEKILPEAQTLFYFLRPGDRYDLKKRSMIEW